MRSALLALVSMNVSSSDLLLTWRAFVCSSALRTCRACPRGRGSSQTWCRCWSERAGNKTPHVELSGERNTAMWDIWALSCTKRNLLSTPTHVALLVCTRHKEDFPPAANSRHYTCALRGSSGKSRGMFLRKGYMVLFYWLILQLRHWLKNTWFKCTSG